MDGDSGPLRNFLFLQSLATPFFPRLAQALSARGHRTHRINFNGGDRLFWPLPGAVDFRGADKEWPAFLAERLAQWETTDIILFGDCRPLHVAARSVARAAGVAVHVVEEGYLRPNWITFERDGVNGHSTLPRDPKWFRLVAHGAPAWTEAAPIPSVFARRASQDVLYSLACAALAWRFPKYQAHRPWNPFLEYAGWARKFARRPLSRRRSALTMSLIVGRPYYLFPLQLDSDSQLRRHSPFGGIERALERVIASFAARAPADTLLVVREHPLDNGLKDWRSRTLALAKASGAQDRILFVETGDLAQSLAGARALVTVNSTVGVIALSFGLPVIALGKAIYDMPDLTFQGGLDDFWTEASPPDPDTFDAFRRVVAHRAQLNGGFFSDEGIRLAVEGAVRRLEARSPWAAANAQAPPAARSGPTAHIHRFPTPLTEPRPIR
jgi:capsular polysaccharide export protein